ncbi:MAG TPA: PilW family protein [Casimicrobiaceae bacterium]|nr:PilW family protein [Casimicrobiaceae bacterium]
MNTNRAAGRSQRAQRGFGLVELMVGLVIGLIAVLVIFQVYTVAEGFKRNSTAAGDAQMNGLFSTFVLGMEIGNSGAGMADAAQDLASCPDPGGPMPQRFAQSFRPIPVLVTDGGGNSKPDSFVVNYSMATTLANSATFAANALPADSYSVQSPGGFHIGDLIVAIASPTAPNSPCGSSVITAAPTIPDANGFVTITHTGSAFSYFAGASRLLNMGPANRAQKIMYKVCDQRAGCPQPPICGALAPCTLDSTPLLDANGQPLANPVGNPLASNIVNLKVEYGIDSDLDAKGLVDTWVQATNGWEPGTLLDPGTGTVVKINQIKAIRIGLIVQSEQFDQTLGDYNWVMFDCADAVKANCPGRLTGTIAAQTTAPTGNWRFRKYETIIPLRNEIWNKS